jgi:hypothetical protein
VEERTTRHEGYAISQRKRKRGGSLRLDEDGARQRKTRLNRSRLGGIAVAGPYDSLVAIDVRLEALQGMLRKKIW